MRILLALWSRLVRRHGGEAAEYEPEVLFSGWVELPALFRQLPHPH